MGLKPVLTVEDLYTTDSNLYRFPGLVSYSFAWDIQKRLVEKRIRGEISDTLLLLEHNHVYTLGKHGNRQNILFNDEQLREKGIEVFHIERGGDVTYHGPGQIVGYPIFLLKNKLGGIRSFIENMEKVFTILLNAYGIQASTDIKLPGVWVGEDKITAIGIAVKRWVTYHGFAFNVNTDLSFFKGIVPCGLKNKGVASMERLLGRKLDIDKIMEKIVEIFSYVFKKRFIIRDETFLA